MVTHTYLRTGQTTRYRTHDETAEPSEGVREGEETAGGRWIWEMTCMVLVIAWADNLWLILKEKYMRQSRWDEISVCNFLNLLFTKLKLFLFFWLHSLLSWPYERIVTPKINVDERWALLNWACILRLD